MKYAFAILALALCVGCEVELNSPRAKTTTKKALPIYTKCPQCKQGQCPPADPPLSLRYKNWGPSCGYASTASSLANAMRLGDAQYVRQHHYGPSTINGSQTSAMDRLGVKYVLETNGDPAHLEWASRTRRMPVVKCHSGHITNFAGFCGDKAYVLNNNLTSKYEVWDKQRFIRTWQSFGGVALTPIDRPLPPSKWHWSRT